MFYFLVCWKLPFYMLLLNLDLPEEAIVLKREVSLTDVYSWRILAEMAVESGCDYDDFKTAVLTEKRIKMGENHLLDWQVMS